MRQRKLRQIIAYFDQPHVAEEPARLTEYRLLTQGFLNDYAQYLQAVERDLPRKPIAGTILSRLRAALSAMANLLIV